MVRTGTLAEWSTRVGHAPQDAAPDEVPAVGRHGRSGRTPRLPRPAQSPSAGFPRMALPSALTPLILSHSTTACRASWAWVREFSSTWSLNMAQSGWAGGPTGGYSMPSGSTAVSSIRRASACPAMRATQGRMPSETSVPFHRHQDGAGQVSDPDSLTSFIRVHVVPLPVWDLRLFLGAGPGTQFTSDIHSRSRRCSYGLRPSPSPLPPVPPETTFSRGSRPS